MRQPNLKNCASVSWFDSTRKMPAEQMNPTGAPSCGNMPYQARRPGGAFSMGTNDAWPDERPLHRVELRPFEIDRVPVVNAQFAAFLNERASTGAQDGTLIDLDRGGASVLDIRPLLWKDGWPVAGENAKAGTYEIQSVRTGT